MIKKILIANRGEIACRIARTARELGICTVAPYLAEDQISGMEEWVDVLVPVKIGKNEISPYLNGQFLVNLALTQGCDSIHPGYGYLSENPDFSALVSKSGLIFMGPSAEAIKSMADKITAKKIMNAAQVPVAPSMEVMCDDQGNILNYSELETCEFPVMIKAAYGGGGRGMRWVESKNEFKDSLEAAAGEAFRHFSSAKIYVEKAIPTARHIEIQFARDRFGGSCHMFARDCSVQRRHQKVIEEAPATGVHPEVLEAMYQATLNVAQIIEYVGVGTVEFLLAPDESFYFLEMNTRLQVEHGITELITGLDLIRWQINLAEGQKLPLCQEQIIMRGHAIEARVYAEAPEKNFLPSPGYIEKFLLPEEGLGSSNTIRVDHSFGHGVRHGPVSERFDPLIAKVMAFGNSRDEALRKLQRALKETQIWGVENNLSYLESIHKNEQFQNQEIHNQWLEKYHGALTHKHSMEYAEFDASAIAAILAVTTEKSENYRPRFFIDRLRDGFGRSYKINLRGPKKNELIPMGLTEFPGEHFEVTHGEEKSKFQCRFLRSGVMKFIHDVTGKSLEVGFYRKNNVLYLNVGGQRDYFEMVAPGSKDENLEVLDGLIRMPLDGTVTQIYEENNAPVEMGQKLVTVEAMKMEHVLKASKKGRIEGLNLTIGTTLRRGDLICHITD